MPELLKSLPEGDSPLALSDHEEDESNSDQDQELAHQIEEAMEDTESMETQASQEEEEGGAENTAYPLRDACVDKEKGPVRENTLTDTLSGGMIHNRENTLMDNPRHGDGADTRYGRVVENTATLPSDTGYGGIMENTIISPITMHSSGRRERSWRILALTL